MNAQEENTEVVPTPPQRLVSLDQFRGYTVLAMLLVNFFGDYDACPEILKHRYTYCSYADTIMPQFLFAVGFALRLTFVSRKIQQGKRAAYLRVVRRLLGLLLVSLIVYKIGPRATTWEELQSLGLWGALREPFKRHWFKTLTHIAVTSLWLLPVIQLSQGIRLVWMCGSVLLHGWLSYNFNFEWTYTPPNAIEGGPLGFLTWIVPATFGTLACDWFRSIPFQSKTRVVTRSPVPIAITTAGCLMILGYVLSCGTRVYDHAPPLNTTAQSVDLAESPVIPTRTQFQSKLENTETIFGWLAEPPMTMPPPPNERRWNYWMMSQRAATPSYLLFATGFSLLTYIAFYAQCDLGKFQVSVFRTLGTNALVAYILHDFVGDAVRPFLPKDAPLLWVLLGLFIYIGITWLFVRGLEKKELYLRA